MLFRSRHIGLGIGYSVQEPFRYGMTLVKVLELPFAPLMPDLVIEFDKGDTVCIKTRDFGLAFDVDRECFSLTEDEFYSDTESVQFRMDQLLEYGWEKVE